MSIGAARTSARRMSPAEFRAFQEKRPEPERWELIGGQPVMMVPPTIAHNRIADNLSSLLNAALARHDPSRFAIQRSGVELGRIDDEYRPEPDLMVIDADYAPGQRFVEQAYLLAEIVSQTDYERVPGTGKPWIEIKRRLYLDHPSCQAVLVVEQDRMEVRLDVKEADRWASSTLALPDEWLLLPAFGLECRVFELYHLTPIGRRAGAA